MKIRSLTIKNFRGFEDATLDLDRPLTVLFGVNGSGKSSVLAACAIALSEATRTWTPTETINSSRPIAKDTDVRSGASDLSLTAILTNSDTAQEVTAHYELHPRSTRSSRSTNVTPESGSLPCLSFLYDASRDIAMGNEAFSDDMALVVDQRSDGNRRLLAFTADLAQRLAIGYADPADPREREAIVLIDEIELHLHPTWQRRVLAVLQATFPRCQFIVTTHSPQVLSEVPNEAVVLVENFRFSRPRIPTAGRDTNAILTELMDTTERPGAELEAIRAISVLLDEGKPAEARAKLDELAQALSERDCEIMSLKTMLHFLEEQG